MTPKTNLAREAIVKAFIGFDSFSEKDTHEIAFHLTDWIDDLQTFVNFLENPDKFNNEEIRKIIIGILAHVPHHVNEASEMLFDAAEQDGPKDIREK
jgi:hypothetical protein